MNMNMCFDWKDDICWCADSRDCKNDDCFRHMLNRVSRSGIFTMSHLKYTELCPLIDETEEQKGE